MKKFSLIIFLMLAIFILAGCQKTVTVEFPADFFENEDTQALAEQFRSGDGNKKVTVNDDNSITLTVTEDKYNLIMDNMKEMIEGMYETIGQEDSFFKTVTAFQHDENYTNLTVTVDRQAYEASNENVSVEQIVYVARLYNVYNMNNDGTITLQFKDSATGEIYDTEEHSVSGK